MNKQQRIASLMDSLMIIVDINDIQRTALLQLLDYFYDSAYFDGREYQLGYMMEKLYSKNK